MLSGRNREAREGASKKVCKGGRLTVTPVMVLPTVSVMPPRMPPAPGCLEG